MIGARMLTIQSARAAARCAAIATIVANHLPVAIQGQTLTPNDSSLRRTAEIERVRQIARALVPHAPEKTFVGRLVDGLMGRPDGPARPRGPLAGTTLADDRVRHAQQDSALRALSEVDTLALAGSPTRDEYLLLRKTLDAERAARICGDHVTDLDPLAGWQITLQSAALAAPVGTAADRQGALEEWSTVAADIDSLAERLRLGLARDVTTPQVEAGRVLGELDQLLATPPAESPLASPAARTADWDFRTEFLRLVATQIYPAIQRYRDYLANTYLPNARTTVGLSALPNGVACYRAKLRLSTSLDVSPDSIRRLGFAELTRVEHEIKMLAAGTLGARSARAAFDTLRLAPRFRFTTRDQMLKTARAALGRAESASAKWFEDFRADTDTVAVVSFPAFREQNAPPAMYDVGTYWLNTYAPASRGLADAEATAFHEGVPGHYLQVTITLAEWRRRVRTREESAPIQWSTATMEGWATYAEELADEMGLYSSPVSRLGMLSNRAWRAARCVVDPGLHVFGWSRPQAIEFMLAHTDRSRLEIEGEVDWYISNPARAPTY